MSDPCFVFNLSVQFCLSTNDHLFSSLVDLLVCKLALIMCHKKFMGVLKTNLLCHRVFVFVFVFVFVCEFVFVFVLCHKKFFGCWKQIWLCSASMSLWIIVPLSSRTFSSPKLRIWRTQAFHFHGGRFAYICESRQEFEKKCGIFGKGGPNHTTWG